MRSLAKATVPAVLIVLALVAGGCGETRAEKDALLACPSLSAVANRECTTVADAHQAKRREDVEHERGEVEDALKRNRAAETAAAIEAIGDTR